MDGWLAALSESRETNLACPCIDRVAATIDVYGVKDAGIP